MLQLQMKKPFCKRNVRLWSFVHRSCQGEEEGGKCVNATPDLKKERLACILM
jgi:hypothetical protein